MIQLLERTGKKTKGERAKVQALTMVTEGIEEEREGRKLCMLVKESV